MIICAGLPKTGSKSCSTALRKLGQDQTKRYFSFKNPLSFIVQVTKLLITLRRLNFLQYLGLHILMASWQSKIYLDGVHFRCGKLLLRHPWADLDETFRMYRVDLEIMHREIFDFRFRPRTGSWLFFANRKLKRSEPEVETYLIGKLASFWNESPIFVFLTFKPGNRYNHFCPGISIYYYIGDKIFQKPLAPPLFKISKK